jgi:hypothetical protein
VPALELMELLNRRRIWMYGQGGCDVTTVVILYPPDHILEVLHAHLQRLAGDEYGLVTTHLDVNQLPLAGIPKGKQ